jgi:tetratricopeptide (TPR) repeat protein
MAVSCVSTRSLTIEIPEKAKKSLPERIQSLTLISRVFNDKFTDLPADSLQLIFYRKSFSYDTLINDKSAIDTTLKALGDLLYESGRFDIVIPENRLINAGGSFSLAAEMTMPEVKEMCETFSTDAVLSLDFFKTRVITDFEKLASFDPETNSFFDAAHAEMKVNYEAMFRLYDPVSEKVIYRQFFRDTLFWDETDLSISSLFTHFTPVKQALTEAGITIALDLSGEISPIWRTEKRKYYVKGDDVFKQTNPMVDSSYWEKAIPLWKSAADNTKSKSAKSKAEFNVALGYEMLGDVESSIEWALKSFETMYRTLTYEYLEILKYRRAETKRSK